MDNKNTSTVPADTGNQVEMVTIYNQPSDFPGKFVARIWRIDPKGPIPYEHPLTTGDSFKEVDDWVNTWNSNMRWLGRQNDDDACIVGTYLIL